MIGHPTAPTYTFPDPLGGLGLRAAPIIRFQWDPRLRYVEEVDKLLEELDIKPDDTPPAADTVAAAAVLDLLADDDEEE